MPWFVLYTKSRSEKIVADKLMTMSIEVYCPMMKIKRKWSDRIKVVEEPLFRSYCFVNLEEHERYKVFDAPGVVRYLFWQNKPAVVREAEIDAIKLMLNEVDHTLLSVQTFQPGDQLRIASGTFSDTTGKVIRQQGKIVTVLLDTLQLMLTVDLSRTVIAV
ncbi:UpxY family transcription antiterminator [Spirosoma gilvum]